MASIPTGYLEATYVWQQTGIQREMVNVMGHEVPGAVTNPDVMALTLFDFWSLALKGQQSTSFIFQRVEVRVGNDGDPLLGSFTGSTVGTGGINALPVNTSVLVTKRTAVGGRRNRGRMFLPGFCDESNVGPNGLMTVAELNSIQAAIIEWYDDLVAAGWAPYILHADPLDAPTEITGLQANQLLATQRRRMRP